jgi:transposase
VGECLRRAEAAGVVWPLPADLDDAALEARLYPPLVPATAERPLPDFAVIQAELRRKGMTLQLLWREYRAACPDAYRYSRFCDLYRAWAGTQDSVLRQPHTPGDKLFVDYAGQTAEVIDPLTGEIRVAQIFVAVLGYSNYTYVEATWTQSVADWIGAHVRALEHLGGVPAAIVPDNLKSGITKACRPLPRAFLWPRIAQRSPDRETETAPEKLRRSDGNSVSDDLFVWGKPANRGPFSAEP